MGDMFVTKDNEDWKARVYEHSPSETEVEGNETYLYEFPQSTQIGPATAVDSSEWFVSIKVDAVGDVPEGWVNIWKRKQRDAYDEGLMIVLHAPPGGGGEDGEDDNEYGDGGEDEDGRDGATGGATGSAAGGAYWGSSWGRGS